MRERERWDRQTDQQTEIEIEFLQRERERERESFGKGVIFIATYVNIFMKFLVNLFDPPNVLMCTPAFTKYSHTLWKLWLLSLYTEQVLPF